jgi:bifunctional DNA-binding transcriptional regulator/antitoxin component of YhaV-PrlF toxin-antitoxin module
MLEEGKGRFIDAGWRITIPKSMREALGWGKDTAVCVSYDGINLYVKHPIHCLTCPDVTRMGSLGKIVIPQRIREEAGLYRGQILSLSVTGEYVTVRPGENQVRCQSCGSEWDVSQVLPGVYLCPRCRESLERVALAQGR